LLVLVVVEELVNLLLVVVQFLEMEALAEVVHTGLQIWLVVLLFNQPALLVDMVMLVALVIVAQTIMLAQVAVGLELLVLTQLPPQQEQVEMV
jgi:hypothetical protein